MKIGYLSNAYSTFEEEFGINIPFTKGQADAFHDSEEILLTPRQLDQVSDQLMKSSFLLNQSHSLSPVSMSLFVINDTLWKMMEKKPWEPEKMLAMTTFPTCSWDPRFEKTNNPKGVRREKPGPGKISIGEEPKPILSISGYGGDFGGFIEQSHLTARKWGIPESRRGIPNYVFCEAMIDAALDRANIEIHPSPRDILDYDFSESAKVFYDHGVLLTIPGEDVTLSITDRKPSQMKGEVILLIGTRVDHETDSYRGLLVDLWLWSFARRFG